MEGWVVGTENAIDEVPMLVVALLWSAWVTNPYDPPRLTQHRTEIVVPAAGPLAGANVGDRVVLSLGVKS